MFTRVLFTLAGLLGLGALVPLYQQPGSPTYYGLLGVVAAWQFLFLLIAWRPAELRLAMIPAVIEKALWVITFVTLYRRGGMTDTDLAAGTIPHGLLGVLFAIAYFRTSARETQALPAHHTPPAQHAAPAQHAPPAHAPPPQPAPEEPPAAGA
jgi:hypothetical protein